MLTEREREKIRNNRDIVIDIRYAGKYQISHSNTFGVNNNFLKKEEEFMNFNEFKNRLMEIVQEYTKD
jgi:hypothetical protein